MMGVGVVEDADGGQLDRTWPRSSHTRSMADSSVEAAARSLGDRLHVIGCRDVVREDSQRIGAQVPSMLAMTDVQSTAAMRAADASIVA